MSIIKTVLGVNIKLSGCTLSLPVDNNYENVCSFVTLRDVKDISLLFETNKDFYYRKALSAVGNGSGDFFHYTTNADAADSRCNCILCWTFRKGFSRFEYPANYAKMLCCVDQLRNDNIFPDMKMVDFIEIAQSYKIPEDAVPYLWKMIFGNTIPKHNESESPSLQTSIKDMLEGVDIATLVDHEGVHTNRFTLSLNNKIKDLQRRYDTDLNLNIRFKKVKQLSSRALVSHQIRSMRAAINATGLTEYTLPNILERHEALSVFWKHKFLHDHLLGHIGNVRIKDKKYKYKGFKGLTRFEDKEKRLKNRLAIMGSKITVAERGLYLLDPLKLAPVQSAYEAFNAEFSPFLTDTERKNVLTLFRLLDGVVRTSLGKEFMVSKNGIFYLEFLTQSAQKILDDVSEQTKDLSEDQILKDNRFWWTKALANEMQYIRQEKYIWTNSSQTNSYIGSLDKRLNITLAVQEYIQRLVNLQWADIIKDSPSAGNSLVSWEFRKAMLVREKQTDYVLNYIADSMMDVYFNLPQRLKNYINMKWKEYQLSCMKRFMAASNIMTQLDPSIQYNVDQLLNSFFGDIQSVGLHENWYFYWGSKKKRENIFFWTRARALYQYTLGVNPDPPSRPTRGLLALNQKADAIALEATMESAYSELSNKVTAELQLNYLIFNDYTPTADKMDMFLHSSLHPNEMRVFRRFKDSSGRAMEAFSIYYMATFLRPHFVPQIGPRTKKDAAADSEIIQSKMKPLLKKIDDQREVFKEIVYRRELLKRSILNKMATFEDKYKHRRLWVFEDSRVFVYLDYQKYGENLMPQTDPGEGQSSGGVPQPDPDDERGGGESKQRYYEAAGSTVSRNNRDNTWKNLGKTSGLHKAWVENIVLDMVRVRMHKSFDIKNGTRRIEITTIEVPFGDIYDSFRDYKHITDQRNIENEIERKRREEKEIQRKLMLERRQMLIGLSKAELDEKRREDNQAQYIEEINNLMYSEDKAPARLAHFYTWLKRMQGANDRVNRSAVLQGIMKECNKEPHLYVMFEKGRDQWIKENNLDGKYKWQKNRKWQKTDKAMRTPEEERDYNLSLDIKTAYKDVPKRVQSNFFTRRYTRYIFIYTKNISDRDQLVKNDINNLMRDKRGPERLAFMYEFKEKWLKAVKRADEAHSKKYKEWKRKQDSKNWRKDNDGLLIAMRKSDWGKKHMTGRTDIKLVDGNIVRENWSPAVLAARQRVLFIINEIIAKINDVDENPLLVDETAEDIINYVLTELDDDVERLLKIPKLTYTKEMWESEVDKSLAKLKSTDFLFLKDYVSIPKERAFNKSLKPSRKQETEYQKEFMVINKDNTAIYPVPTSEELHIKSAEFDPKRGDTAAPVRIACGPNSWFEINQSSDIMRMTGLSTSDRLQMAEDIYAMEQEIVQNSGAVFNSGNIALRKQIKRVEASIKSKTPNSGSSKIEWKLSDGDGSLRIVDDCVGSFHYDFDTLKQVRNAAPWEFPTHVRLNCVYLDSIRGRDSINFQSIRKLVPFYIVSLYRATDLGYDRIRVRNRASNTFLPQQLKYRDYKNPSKSKKQRITPRYYTKEDYKGYKYSLCLSEKEFVELTAKNQLEGPRTRVKTHIPYAFLHKYHKMLYEHERLRMGKILKDKKKGIESMMQGLTIDDSDDDTAPLSDGLIQLGDNGGPISYYDGVFSINNAHFKLDGSITSHHKYRHKIIHVGTTMYHRAGEMKRLPFDPISQVAIKSDILFACVITKHVIGYRSKSISVYTYDKKWKETNIPIKVMPNTILRWCGDTLLVVTDNIVHCFDKNKRYAKTHVLKGHTGIINTICVKENVGDTLANVIVTGSDDNSLIAWMGGRPIIRKGRRVLAKVRHKFRFGKVRNIREVTICDVDLFATPKQKKSTGVYPCEASAYVKSMYSHTNSVVEVTWGKHVVSSSRDNTLRIWKGEGEGALFELLFALDFTALGLPAQVIRSSYDELFTRGNKSMQLSQAHLLPSGNTVSITAVPVTNEVLYCYGKVLGKLDANTGTRVPFSDDIVNSVSGVITYSGVFDVDVQALLTLEKERRIMANEDYDTYDSDDSMIVDDNGVQTSYYLKEYRQNILAKKAKKKKMSVKKYKEYIKKRRKKWKREVLEWQAKKKGMSVDKYKEIEQLRQKREKSERTEQYDPDEWEDVAPPPVQVEQVVEQAVEQEDDLDYLWDWSSDDDSDDSDDGRGGGESKK